MLFFVLYIILDCLHTQVNSMRYYILDHTLHYFTIYTGTLRGGDAATPRESRTLAPVLFCVGERGSERKRQCRHASERC